MNLVSRSVYKGIIFKNKLINKKNAIREKARYVLKVMADRIKGLGGNWELLSCVDVYTIHPLVELLSSEILPTLGRSHHIGIHWYYSRPPVIDIDFEMDMRGTISEIII